MTAMARRRPCCAGTPPTPASSSSSSSLFQRMQRTIQRMLVVSLVTVSGHSPSTSLVAAAHQQPDQQQLSRDLYFNNNNDFDDYEDIQLKLVGGVDLKEALYPWFAVTAGGILCGASLVHGDIIVSAAHCGEGLYSGVRLGGIQRTEGTWYGVSEVRLHPEYQGGASTGDVSIAKLDRVVDNIQPVQMEFETNSPIEGSTMIVLGYGAVEEEGDISDVQQQISSNVVSYQFCFDIYGPLIDDQTMFCTLSEQYPPQDTCQGDSGGPLFDSETGRLQGVVAFGSGCGRPGIPSVNTRLAAFQDWISETICELSSIPPTSCSFPAGAKLSTESPTPAPPPPIPYVTPSPTRRATPRPTTAHPSSSPVRLPTPPPTARPTRAPTLPPVTSAPTTRGPVPAPTELPVPLATQSPRVSSSALPDAVSAPMTPTAMPIPTSIPPEGAGAANQETLPPSNSFNRNIVGAIQDQSDTSHAGSARMSVFWYIVIGSMASTTIYVVDLIAL